MDANEFMGLGILVGTFGTLLVFVCGTMERHLRRVQRVIHQTIEDNEKYVM